MQFQDSFKTIGAFFPCTTVTGCSLTFWPFTAPLLAYMFKSAAAYVWSVTTRPPLSGTYGTSLADPLAALLTYEHVPHRGHGPACMSSVTIPVVVVVVCVLPSITACTVVQAVVKATSQSNGKGQILTPWGSETLERISMKLGIYNRVADMPTHANPCGAATTWVVWANT